MLVQNCESKSLVAKVPEIGQFIDGGYYAGSIRVQDKVYGVLVSPKIAGDVRFQWSSTAGLTEGESSRCDGRQNTLNMVSAGSDLAYYIWSLIIDGYSDWHLPAKDELEICYRAFKPTTEANSHFGDGQNPSSIPPASPYVEGFPKKTQCVQFQIGGREAFEEFWYWSSTQSGQDYAKFQNFRCGEQGTSGKEFLNRARAVRWIDLSHLF